MPSAFEMLNSVFHALFAAHPLYTMARVTTLVTLCVFGVAIWLLSEKKDRPWLAGVFLFYLPICVLAFFYLRIPLIQLSKRIFHPTLEEFPFLNTFMAPLSEEPAKLLVVPFLFLLKKINEKNWLAWGLTIGLGFGVGEIWFLAHDNAQQPGLHLLPWHFFKPFFVERCLVVFLHGAFVATSIYGIVKGRFWLPLGILAAMVFHYFLNFPIYLIQQGPVELYEENALKYKNFVLGYAVFMLVWLACLKWRMKKL